MNSELLLDSLQVQGFRAFEDLQIPKLGRVNLITGKNNVGKTCLLEALQVYARRGEPNVLQSLLVRRDEMYFSNSLKQDAAAKSLDKVKYIFHGRSDLSASVTFQIGDCGDEEKRLTVGVFHHNSMGVEGAFSSDMLDEMREVGITESGAFSSDMLDEMREVGITESSAKWFGITNGSETKGMPFLPSSFRNRSIPSVSDSQIPHTFIWSRGIDKSLLGHWWDRAVVDLTDDDVIRALQIIVPNASRVDLVGVREGNPERVPIVRLRDGEQVSSVPMKSLGEGVSRMFGLALALVSSRNGMLMIDEIETGLHYSVQADMWRLVFRTARDLNVQVFATTHSSDCIRAFEEAAREDAEAEGMLVRLENKNGKVRAVAFDEEDLEIVVNEGIEVR